MIFPLFIVNLSRVVYIVIRKYVIKYKRRLVHYCRKKGWMCITKKS